MKQLLATALIGSLLAIATAVLVLLYWLMMIVFRVLYLLTLPLHLAWRAVRAA